LLPLEEKFHEMEPFIKQQCDKKARQLEELEVIATMLESFINECTSACKIFTLGTLETIF